MVSSSNSENVPVLICWAFPTGLNVSKNLAFQVPELLRAVDSRACALVQKPGVDLCQRFLVMHGGYETGDAKVAPLYAISRKALK